MYLKMYCKVDRTVISSVVIICIEGVVSFGIMNKCKTSGSGFKEQVSNPEIEVSVDVNPVVACR